LGGIGKLNHGREQIIKILESENLEIAASNLGIAQGVYNYAAGYAKERIQFGKPITKFEAIQHMLIDMAINIQTGRLLTYKASWLAERGERCLSESLMARIHTTQTARKASLQSLQIMGGYGYTMEYDVQRYVRDSLVSLSGGETIEVLKGFIGPLIDLG